MRFLNPYFVNWLFKSLKASKFDWKFQKKIRLTNTNIWSYVVQQQHILSGRDIFEGIAKHRNAPPKK